jgi:hypothetical protein
MIDRAGWGQRGPLGFVAGWSRRAGWALLAACLVLPAGRGSASEFSWRSGSTAVLGIAIDTNPLEALTAGGRRTDALARLEGGFWLGASPGTGKGGARFALRWGADRFVRERGETRALVTGSAGWSGTWRGGSVTLQGSIYTRSFPHAERRNARRYEVSAQSERLVGGDSAVRLRLQGIRVETGSLGPRERSGGAARLEIQRSVDGGWMARGGVEAGLLGIDRPVQSGAPDADPAAGGRMQRDRWLWFGETIRGLGPPYIELSGGVRRVWSNSSGYSLGRFETSLLVSRMLLLDVSGQLLGRLERPLYDDARVTIDVREDQEEAEFGARSGLTLRLLRPLGAGLRAEVQASWERNESLIRGEPYPKGSCLAALRYSAGDPDPTGR